jgi:hypothetical protein
LPEREGWVDRNKLYGIRGRGRKELIALGKKYGLKSLPTPSTGCALTEEQFALKVHDLINFDADFHRWDFEMLKLGRHFRFDAQTKVVVGRREAENEQLEYMYRAPGSRGTAMLFPENLTGPRAIVIGPVSETAIDFTVGLIMRYSKNYLPDEAQIGLEQDGQFRVLIGQSNQLAASAKTLATVD